MKAKVVQSCLTLCDPHMCTCKTCVQLLSCVQIFVTPWTVAHQVPLSMEFSQARTLEWVAISHSRGFS